MATTERSSSLEVEGEEEPELIVADFHEDEKPLVCVEYPGMPRVNETAWWLC